jgi:acetyltransferase-like isoleucine patch superfamily enzyme
MRAARLVLRTTDGQFAARSRQLSRLRGRVYQAMLPDVFGPGTRVGGKLVLKNPGQVRLGRGVILSSGCMLACGEITPRYCPSITVGAKTFFNIGSAVAAELQPIEIGEDVLFGPHTVVVDADHGFEDPDVAIARQPMIDRGPITIGDGAWIAAGAVVLGGTTIAPRSVVAANSVVRGDFPERCIIAGAPARVVRELP